MPVKVHNRTIFWQQILQRWGLSGRRGVLTIIDEILNGVPVLLKMILNSWNKVIPVRCFTSAFEQTGGGIMYQRAADILRSAKRVTAFTGAGISVESGIPTFRGKSGLWNRYDPKFLDINYFLTFPDECWGRIKEIFYDFFGQAKPNAAHYALHELEAMSLLDVVITQNIDNLHQEAGNSTVYEYHGTARFLVCMECGKKYHVSEVDLIKLPPCCISCGGILKPDFVFFGEGIPEPASSMSALEAEKSDVFLLIGTSGKVTPACYIPYMAKENGARIIEINTEASAYTHAISDVFLKGRATEVMEALMETLEGM